MDLSRQKKVLTNLKIAQWKLSVVRNRRKIEEKWTEPEGPMEHRQVDQHTHCGSRRERERKGSGRIFEEMMAENFPSFMKDINVNIQEAQWTPSKINLETYTETYYPKTFKSQRQRENLENNKKWLVTHKSLNKIISRFLVRNYRGQKVVGTLYTKY